MWRRMVIAGSCQYKKMSDVSPNGFIRNAETRTTTCAHSRFQLHLTEGQQPKDNFLLPAIFFSNPLFPGHGEKIGSSSVTYTLDSFAIHRAMHSANLVCALTASTSERKVLKLSRLTSKIFLASDEEVFIVVDETS